MSQMRPLVNKKWSSQKSDVNDRKKVFVKEKFKLAYNESLKNEFFYRLVGIN